MHALIIEDEFLIAVALEDMLGELGYRTFDWAATEEEAISAVKRGRPDLITADIQLREGNGVSAIAEINRENPGIPTIFITANDGVVANVKGAVVLSKPVRHAELRQAVAKSSKHREEGPLELPSRSELAKLICDFQVASR